MVPNKLTAKTQRRATCSTPAPEVTFFNCWGEKTTAYVIYREGNIALLYLLPSSGNDTCETSGCLIIGRSTNSRQTVYTTPYEWDYLSYVNLKGSLTSEQVKQLCKLLNQPKKKKTKKNA